MTTINTPPPNGINASLVHKISGLYKIIYQSSKKLNKADKLGLRAKTEQSCLNCLHLSIEAALLTKEEKLPIVKKLKIEIEMPKQLVRLEQELGIINEKIYLAWQEKLQEISKMATGWINHLLKKESR